MRRRDMRRGEVMRRRDMRQTEVPGQDRRRGGTPGRKMRRVGTRAITLATLAGACLAGVAGTPAPAQAAPQPAAQPTGVVTRPLGPTAILSQRFAGDECEVGSTDTFSPAPDDLGVVIATDLVPFDAAHEFFRGQGVRIAVIDSGVAASNPALAGAKVEPGVALAGDDANADPYGHGTAVASIIAGQADSNAPIDGVAPDATIVPIKIMETPPREVTQAYTNQLGERLVEAIEWATEQGVDIINISMTVEESNAALERAVNSAVASGIVVVASGGNLAGQIPEDYDPMDESPRYPAAYPGVLGVTAVDGEGMASSQVYHSQTTGVSAPGNFYVVANGTSGTCLTAIDNPSTSFAAAYVSGVAAVAMSAHPDESGAEIIHRIETTAVRANPDEKDFLTGWGIVDPQGAVNFVDDGSVPGPDSPNFEARAVPERAGRDVPQAAPDTQVESQESGSAWTVAGVLGAVVLLVAAAGIGRMASRDESPDSQ